MSWGHRAPDLWLDLQCGLGSSTSSSGASVSLFGMMLGLVWNGDKVVFEMPCPGTNVTSLLYHLMQAAPCLRHRGLAANKPVFSRAGLGTCPWHPLLLTLSLPKPLLASSPMQVPPALAHT